MHHQLNPQQKLAIDHLDGPLLVLAGAGSGKTKVVTYRIASLITKGIPPNDILAVTFTNKAAEEMKKRIQHMTKAYIYATTFHSFGSRILREFISYLGYTSDFIIYDEEDSLKLIKNLLKQLQIKEEKGIGKKIKLRISSTKNDLLSIDEIKKYQSYDPEEKIFLQIYPWYQQKLQEYNAVDFDDLLYLPVKLLQNHSSVQQILQKRYPFLLIDEYQDTNFAQYILIKTLLGTNQNIFAVGDPDQSIYSWRGARFQNILNFENDFPNAKIIKLEQNYRSTCTILHAANHLIEHNEKRYEKNLFSTLGEGSKIQYFQAYQEKNEAEIVTEKILWHNKKDKISLDEIAIFYRTNAQSRSFEDFLLAKKIPYVIYGGISFYQRKEIKDILAFLKLLISDKDYLSFSRTINIPKRGIGTTSLQKILQTAEQNKISCLQLCRNIIQGTCHFSLSQKQKENIFSYLQVFTYLQNWHQKYSSISSLIEELLIQVKYYDHLKEDPETFQDRKDNIEQFLVKAKEWEEEHEKQTLLDFLQELTLATTLDNKETAAKVKLMSLHHGKGLEFTVVFLTGLEEDLFPHINCKNNIDEIEEERRLCYVGMTRAKKHLYLSNCNYRYLWGGQHHMIPSRFIREIPEKYFTSSRQDFSSYKEKETAIIGTKVFHQVFGEGTILKTSSSSVGEIYDVHFEDGITRSLVAKYAKLIFQE